MKRNLGGPALVVAIIALFVALGQVAVAAGIVPLARHAITAGTATNARHAITARTAANALKLRGETPAQLRRNLRGPRGPVGPTGAQGAQGAPGSAMVTLHTQTFSLNEAGTDGDTLDVTASCDSGQKAIGGGYVTDGAMGLNGGVLGADSRPTDADDGWSMFVANLDGTAAHTGKVYAICFG